MIVVVDFGSQTAHLIGRRIKQLGVQTAFLPPEHLLSFVEKNKPKGIIFSGGPSSVYSEKAPTISPAIFNIGIPILSICYGFQLTAKLLGGKVESGRKEYGPANVKITNHKSQITKDIPEEFTVWMSHGDEIMTLPSEFEILGSTKTVRYACVQHTKRKLFGLLFHPEVEHTHFGMQILENFVTICGENVSHHVIDVKEIEGEIKKTVGDSYVIGAVSGGVDSTVAGVLVGQAIGDRFLPIYVENGLMREGTEIHVKKIFTQYGHVKPIVVNTVGETLKKLQGIVEPEEKRKIIGNLYIQIFEQKMAEFVVSGKPVKFLLQGTIYSDVIESQGTRHADKIKSHHNVGGLPEDMKLKLLEPLRHFYKDEVRKIGEELGLPHEFVYKQPFPGPGYAVRIRGEVTEERLLKAKHADAIVLEEMEKSGWLSKVFLSFPVMTGADSTAVKGDGRFFGEVIALRVVESSDVMTSTWARLPYEVLQKISSRIVNEVSGISRVVYDISTKPPATMEWE